MPTEEGRMCEGGIWQDLPNIGCSSQVVVMHEKRHLIETAGRRRKEEGERLNSATLADKVLKKPINVTSLTTVSYSHPNLSKGLSTSHLHFDFNICIL